MRKLARQLTSRLICDLRYHADHVVSDARRKNHCLKIGNVEISIIQRRLRIFDTIVVEYEGIPLWLPIIQRIMLRRAVRRFLLAVCVVSE